MNAPAPLALASVRSADLGDPGEVARLDSFVADHPQGTLFHRPQWSRAVERGCRQRAHYLVAEQGGTLVGCLPLSEIRSPLFGNALVSAGFASGGGLLVAKAAVAEVLAEAGWALAERLGCPALELRGGPFPREWQAQSGVYANFDRKLPNNAEALLASIPKRQRAEIKRAQDFGLETSAGSDAMHREAHWRAYAESVRNLGTPVFPRCLFEAMLEAFDDADIVAVWKDGQPLAAFLNFYFRGACLSYWGGGTAEARRWRANDLIYFEVMRRAAERGLARADFGRSKLGTGAWQRKRIWGFDETPLTYGTRTADGAAPREINPLNPKYRLQVAAWQRLPLWAANRLGPVIARGLG
jgi:FemAB-related protein (PEP-CTERM system-associated)